MTSELPGGVESHGGRAHAEPDGEWQRDRIAPESRGPVQDCGSLLTGPSDGGAQTRGEGAVVALTLGDGSRSDALRATSCLLSPKLGRGSRPVGFTGRTRTGHRVVRFGPTTRMVQA
jgi:hypothetical protein